MCRRRVCLKSYDFTARFMHYKISENTPFRCHSSCAYVSHSDSNQCQLKHLPNLPEAVVVCEDGPDEWVRWVFSVSACHVMLRKAFRMSDGVHDHYELAPASTFPPKPEIFHRIAARVWCAFASLIQNLSNQRVPDAKIWLYRSRQQSRDACRASDRLTHSLHFNTVDLKDFILPSYQFAGVLISFSSWKLPSTPWFFCHSHLINWSLFLFLRVADCQLAYVEIHPRVIIQCVCLIAFI